MTNEVKRRGRTQLLLVAAVFLGPLLLASWMYFSGGLNPQGSTNHGDLLQPIVNIATEMPDAPVVALTGERWLMVYPNEAGCDEDCSTALHRLRQVRLMLGKDMNRVDRVFLHGEQILVQIPSTDGNEGLLMLQDGEFARLLASKQPPASTAGGIFLVDPLGNLVMYFGPDTEPRDMLDDIEHLLRLSRIG